MGNFWLFLVRRFVQIGYKTGSVGEKFNATVFILSQQQVLGGRVGSRGSRACLYLAVLLTKRMTLCHKHPIIYDACDFLV